MLKTSTSWVPFLNTPRVFFAALRALAGADLWQEGNWIVYLNGLVRSQKILQHAIFMTIACIIVPVILPQLIACPAGAGGACLAFHVRELHKAVEETRQSQRVCQRVRHKDVVHLFVGVDPFSDTPTLVAAPYYLLVMAGACVGPISS